MNAGEIKNHAQYLKHQLEWADFLIQSDELLRAEWLLTEGMPGYYRDHPPKQVLEMKRKLYRFMMNLSDYAVNPLDIDVCTPEKANAIITQTLRGQLLVHSVKSWNEKEKIPHLFDMGPGDYWLPIGLKALGLKFTYQPCQVSDLAWEKAKPLFIEHIDEPALSDSPILFTALELIEHIRAPEEILHTLHKADLDPSEIHLSTPRYTFGGGRPNWQDQPGNGHHLLTYTPQEFMSVASQLFPLYDFRYYPGEVMSLVGSKR